MLVIRFLLPFTIVALILFLLLYSAFKLAKQDKAKKKEEDVEEYIKRLKDLIESAKKRAEEGAEDAILDLSRYEAQLEKVTKYKTITDKL